MNVTTQGVQGYEYQYKVTVLVGLLTLTGSSELFVEAMGSEDIKVTITANGQSKIVEVQVKKTTTAVDVVTLGKWLCHFQEKTATENLLSRIAATINTALIITTARCLDSASMFVKKNPDFSAHTSLSLDSAWVNSFADALEKNEYTKNTKLQQDRDQFCKALAKDVKSSTTIADALKRVIVWEELSPGDLEHSIEVLLNKQYKIPQSLVAETARLLEAAVRNGRDDKSNILPEFVRILGEKKGEGPLIDTGYRVRKEETVLIAELQKKGTLLLSGQSLCGKSELAKKIAEHFFQAGAAYRVFDEVSDVFSFFNLNAGEDKICILEDPWGHIAPKQNSLEITRKLELLIRNKRPGHRLIITSREEILKTVSERDQVLSSKETSWNNLTITSEDEIKSLWKEYALDQHLSAATTERLNKLISLSSKTALLQIGELQHLLRYDQQIEQYTDEELLHIARQDSVAIASDLSARNADAADLLAILSQLGDTIVAVSKTDLGFVLSDDTEAYSILPDGFFSTGGGSQPAAFPSYKQQYTLLPVWQKALEFLEDRGFIIVRDDKIRFTHPNYYEAGRRILTTGSASRQDRLLGHFRRSLSCLNPSAALHAAKQLQFLSSQLPANQPGIFDLVFLASDSIFPSVRDKGLEVLAGAVSVLPEDKKHEAETKLNSNDIPSSHIIWHERIAYISLTSDFWARDLFYSLSEDECREIAKKFEQDESVSALQAWNFVRTISAEKSPLSAKAANSLMQYDEALIRKKTVKLIVRGMIPDPDLGLLGLCFSDPHPSVVFAAVETILLNWKDWNPSVKPALRDLLIASQKNLAIAIRSNRFLVKFQGDEEYHNPRWEKYDDTQKQELWNLWAELYVEMMRNLPTDLFFDAVGFGETIRVACGYMNQTNGLSVFECWYQRIDQKIKEGHILDEFELCIADELIDFTKSNTGARLALMEQLLAYPDTSFLISTLKWSISHWDNLTDKEKSITIDLLQSGRVDLRWIKAIAICRHKNPPPEIQQVVFGDERFFELTPSEFISKAPQQVLEDALRMYFGHPQPLYWLATQGNNADFWQAIVSQILTDFTEPYFSMCLRELSSKGLNGFGRPWQDGMKLWEHVCQHYPDKKKITERIIYDTSRINCAIDPAKKMYDLLINALRRAGKEDELADTVAENIELLQQTGHGAKDLLEILEPEFFQKAFLTLEPDAQLYIGATTLKEDPTTLATFQSLLKTVTKAGLSFRFVLTGPIIKKMVSSLPVPASIVEDIDKIPNRVDLIGKEQHKLIQSKDEYKLDNWNGI